MALSLTTEDLIRLQEELAFLDEQRVHIDGKVLKPSECYYYDTNPAHILFNVNCPEALKRRVQEILDRYTGSDDGNS